MSQNVSLYTAIDGREFGNVPKRSSGTAGAENSNNLGLSWGIGHGWGIHYQDLLKSLKIISHNIEAALHKSSSNG